VAYARGYAELPLLFAAFLAAMVFSTLPMVCLALPLFVVLNRVRGVNLWTSLLSGTLVGAMFGLLLRLPNPPQFADALTMAPYGTVAALAFWLVWRTGSVGERASSS
jgi:hypothetical protein